MTNSAIFIYALKSIVLSGVCLGYYSLFLKNTLLHQYNRFYLLITLLISLLGPSIKFDYLTVNEAQAANMSQTMVYLNTIQQTPSVEKFDWGLWTVRLTISISIALLAYLAFGIIRIYQIKRSHPIKASHDVEIVETNLENAPFSFLNLLFWKQSIELTSEHGQRIFQHELAHIRQKHTYDRLFSQVATSLFWFNPFFWLIQKELQNIHEFIADREAIQNGDIQDFAKMLLQAHYGNEFLNPSHSFYYSSLKRRIMLLTTSQNPKYVYLRKVSALPMLALLLAVFSIQVRAQSNKQKKGTTFLVTMYSDSTTFSDPKTGKKVFSVPTGDMPPPPAPTMPAGQAAPENPVQLTAIDKNNIEFKKTINGEDLKFTAQRVNADGVKPTGKPVAISMDSVTFKSVPSEKIKALFVVDGVIVKDLDLNKINPNTIQSMNVLKGEKAVAKYAERGINGVVEITTKKP